MAEVSSQTLHIVARELASELNEARASLEAFGEQQDNLALLRKCNEHLHSVHGALRVAEVYGAALLAEEMGQVANYLIANFEEKRHLAEGLDALMRAMVQLPTYLERVMSGGRDMALVLLPLLNDLRAVRGHALLSEGTLLLLNLSSDQQANPSAGAGEGALTVAQWARKLRTRFQLGLLGWIKGERIDQNLEILSRTAEKLEHVATTQAVFQLWWVVGSVLEALREGGLEGSASIKRLLGQADREMKRLYELGEARYADSPPLELLNNLLYYVARARTNGPRVAAVRASFRLSELLPVDDGVEQARESLSAPSVKLMKTVAAAIKEDLSRVKDALDIFVRQGGTQVDELAPQLELLKKIADTLGVLGLGELRDKVQTETADLQSIVAQKSKATEGTLLRMAATLIKVEDSLDEQLVGMIVPTSEAGAPPKPAGPDDIEFRLVTEAVLRECIVNMARIKEAIAHSVEKPREAQAIDQIPQLMRGITAGLLMLGKTRVVEIMEGIDKALAQFVRSDGLTLPQEAVDRLADAIVAVEYYMETIQAGRADPWYMLDNAETCLRFLAEAQPIPRVESYGASSDHARTIVIEPGASTVALGTVHEPTAVLDPVTQEVRRPTKPVAAPPAAEPPAMPPALTKPVDREVDPEFVELFIEEAKDEIAKLNQFFPLWDANPQDAEALVNVRRSFHTLKGSGRMVGAQLIGDFAWSIENLLNRVINKTLDRTPDMMALMRSAVAAVPELVEQLETGRAPQADIAKIINTSNALAGVRPSSSTPAPQAARRAPEPPVLTTPASRPQAAAVPAPEKKTAPSVTPPSHASSEPPMDPGLHEIYAKETAGHLAAIRKFISACALANAPYPVTEDLHRSCHTLSGTAKTAGARQGIKIAEPLNRYVRKLYDNSVGLSDAGLAALKDAVTAIQQVVDNITESTGFFLDHGRIVNRLVELEHGLDLDISRLAQRVASTNITASEASGEYVAPSIATIVHEQLRVEPKPVLTPAATVEIPVLEAEAPSVTAAQAQSSSIHEPATFELAPIEPNMLATGIFIAEPSSLEATIDVASAMAAESAHAHADAVEITLDPAVPQEAIPQGAAEQVTLDAEAPKDISIAGADAAAAPEEITLGSADWAPGVDLTAEEITLDSAAPLGIDVASTPEEITLGSTEPQDVDLASASEEITLDSAASQEISLDTAALEELSRGMAGVPEISLDLTIPTEAAALAPVSAPDALSLHAIELAPAASEFDAEGSAQIGAVEAGASQEITPTVAAAPEQITPDADATPEEITLGSTGAHAEISLNSGAPIEITINPAALPEEITLDSSAGSEEITLGSTGTHAEVAQDSAADDFKSYTDALLNEIASGSSAAAEEITLDSAATQEVDAISLDGFSGDDEVTFDSVSVPSAAAPAGEVVELEATDASMLETLSWSYENFPQNQDAAASVAVTNDLQAAAAEAAEEIELTSSDDLTQEAVVLEVADELGSEIPDAASITVDEADNIDFTSRSLLQLNEPLPDEASDIIIETAAWAAEFEPPVLPVEASHAVNRDDAETTRVPFLRPADAPTLTDDAVVSSASDAAAHSAPEFAADAAALEAISEAAEAEVEAKSVEAAPAAFEAEPFAVASTPSAVSAVPEVAQSETHVSTSAIEAAPLAEQAAPVSPGIPSEMRSPSDAHPSVTVAEPLEEEEDYADSDFDPDVAAIFTEEATELLDTADHSLSSWRRDRANSALVFELKRAVHTLKGGARMAGIRSMGDLSHELETLMGLVETGQVPAEENVFAALQASLDELHRMRDIVAGGERAQPARQLMRRIRALTAGEPEPAPAPAVAQAPTAAVAVPPIAPEIVATAALAPPPVLEPEAEPEPEPAFDAPPEEIVEIESYSPDDHHIGSQTDIVPTLSDAEALSALEPEVEAVSDVEVEFGADELGAVAPRESVRVEDLPPPAANAANAATGMHAALDVSAVSPELPPDAEPEETTAAAEPQAPALPGRERQTQQQEPREFARVDADLLDNLLNSAGEVSIFRSRMEQQVSSIEFNLAELGRTVTRLKDQLRKIELETEAQILHRHHEEHPDRADFDPLELDRYSTIQQLTRAFAESVSDVSSIEGLLENLTREAQNLLLQQSRVVTEMQNGLMRTRMVPFQRHVQRLSRLVRQVANDTHKRAELVVVGASGELDRQVLERMLPPFEHMLRNSVVHGIETPEERVARGKPAQGTIKVGLHREGSEMVIVLEDDGRGIDVNAVRERAKARGLLAAGRVLSDEEAMQLILEPGFSTASNITQHAGRGVGMDVVVNEIKKLGGALFTQSQPGQGVKFTIRLPFTLAITQALIVRTGDELYALPLPSVEGVARISKSEVVKHLAEETPTFNYGGQIYRLQHLGAFVGGGPSQLPELDVSVPLILIRAGEHSTALVTDELIGSREMVVKSVGPQIATIRGIAGATILGDGRIVIILDMHSLVRAEWRAKGSLEAQGPKQDKRTFALVVDDSITVRRVTQRLLERNGMRVMTAKDGVDALSILQEHVPDVILLDIEMPRMDGYELATQVRADSRLTDIPIVMITSRTGEKHRARAIEIGVNDYLGKPYQENQLLDAIEPLVQARRRKVS
jgi:chemotaxis protein histidine kinase CheA/CheY-like chemotaxis protein